MFLRNTWYVAAREFEIGETPLARTLLGDPVVMYRKADGTPVALEDRCCHRHLPLSMGTREGDDLRCGYHGLRYDCSGVCVEVPGQPSVPAGARVQCYPLLEKWGWVWIWMGDALLASEDKLPDWWHAGHPDWRRSKHHLLEVDCNYRLITDNVMDVSHLAFIHVNSIGSPDILKFPQTTERSGNRVHLNRWIIDTTAPPLYQAAGKFSGNVDRGQVVAFEPPAFVTNHAICVDTGHSGDWESHASKIHLMALSAPTPATATTTHYFFTFVRGFGLEDAALDRVFDEDMISVFMEDVVVLNAQQAMMEMKPGANQINIAVDAGPAASRNIVDEMIAAEQAGANVTQLAGE